MIIEEFKIVTDELGQREDPAWRYGATADQIQAISKAFERHTSGTAYVPASAAVSDLLWELPPPLGFNIGMGYYEREDYGRAARRMIKAEMNILLRRQFAAEAALAAMYNGAPRWRRLLNDAASGKWAEQPRRFVNGVRYEDAMMIFLRWRKPTLIPDWERARNAATLEEIYLMSCALIIRDFLQSLVAQRKCDELGHHVRELFRLRQWALADRHRVRLSALYTAARSELLSQAEQTETDLMDLFAPPTAAISVTLQPFTEKLDQRVHPHHQAAHFDANAQSLSNSAVPRPNQGLDAFRKRAAKQAVVVRFVHPAAQPRRPVVFQADLRECNWGGWQVIKFPFVFHEIVPEFVLL